MVDYSFSTSSYLFSNDTVAETTEKELSEKWRNKNENKNKYLKKFTHKNHH